MNIVFKETQKFSQWWLWLILIGIGILPILGIYKQLIIGEKFGDKPMSDLGLIIFAVFVFSLIAMFWFPMEALPFFIALLFTRTAHEFMDELKYHMDRCTIYETMLHLAMWISVLANTILMFSWGFFTQYRGLFDLHPSFFVFALAIFISILWIGYKEWER